MEMNEKKALKMKRRGKYEFIEWMQVSFSDKF